MTSWACIARYGGVGDNLIASAVLPALKKRYDRVEVITQVPQSCVFENNPFIDKLSVHRVGEIPGEDLVAWKRWHDVRAKEYAFFANLSHSLETLRAFLPMQTQASWPAAWRRKFAAQSYVETVADICGVDAADCAPGFFPTEEEEAQARKTFAEQIGTGPYVGWVLSGTRIDKIYPPSTLTIARLIKELGAHVILVGAPGRDHDMAKRIQEHVLRQNGSLAGLHGMVDEKLENQRFPIRRLLTQLRHCDVVIGPDTGPMWSVAALDVPKVMLLSHAGVDNITKGWVNTRTLHADPEKVPCWPCHLLHDSLDTCTPDATGQAAACISSISVSDVVEAAALALNNRRGLNGEQHASSNDQRLATSERNGSNGSGGAERRPRGLQPKRAGRGRDPVDGKTARAANGPTDRPR